MRPIIVFCGPTISEVEVRNIADVICLPPAVQGSVVAAVQTFDPRVMILIDGGFQSEPAVKHKEILWAIGRGIVVIGASSMGALRAAELSPWMVGVGLIYRWYRRWPLAPDDAVAVLHAPEEMKSLALTDALIDLRMTLKKTLRKGILSSDEVTGLSAAAQRLNFRHRTVDRVIADAFPGMEQEQAMTLHSILRKCWTSQKRIDALEALQTVKRVTFPPAVPSQGMVMTRAFIEDVRMAGMSVTD
jgi:hypothetical protein